MKPMTELAVCSHALLTPADLLLSAFANAPILVAGLVFELNTYWVYIEMLMVFRCAVIYTHAVVH